MSGGRQRLSWRAVTSYSKAQAAVSIHCSAPATSMRCKFENVPARPAATIKLTPPPVLSVFENLQ